MEAVQTKTEKFEAIEITLARFLRLGAVTAAILVGCGMLLLMLDASAAIAPRLVTWGLIVLVSTPVMRVLVAGLVFLRERDYRFAAFCLVVLLALAAGMLLGKTE